MKIILLALGFLTVVATLLPIIREEAWWIRIFDFPRIQIASTALVVLIIYMLLWNKNKLYENIFVGILIASVGYQIFMIYPYTSIASKEVLYSNSQDKVNRFSLLIANVLMENRNVQGYLEIIKATNPDIILSSETDIWWEEHLRQIESEYPFTVKYPLGNTYGMLLHSRLKLIHSRVEFIIEPDIPSIHSWVEMESGTTFELHCLHPRPPHPAESMDTEERDAELLVVGNAVRDSRRPIVVAGDLNDVAWSHTTRLFKRISGLLDPRVGRGLYNTFNAKYPLLRFPLDHIFHSNHFKLIKLERQPYFGSDHFAMLVELSYEPEAQLQQETPSPDREDWEQFHEKLKEVQ